MSGQLPSKWASARGPLARGCAAGRGTPATRAFIPPGTGRGELAEPFPSRGAGDSIASVPWEGLSGAFLVVSLLCFFSPAVSWVGPRWDSRGQSGKRLLGVCLSVC